MYQSNNGDKGFQIVVDRFRMYILFKQNIESEMYLDSNDLICFRKSYADFRCGLLPLAIQSGRYMGTPVEDRICSYCDMNTIETEFHFLLECPYYTGLRNKFLPLYYHRHPSHSRSW